MDGTKWEQLLEQDVELAKLSSMVANPLFFDKYDCGGNEISIGAAVSSAYTYQDRNGTIFPVEGTVVSISPYGVEVVSSKYLNEVAVASNKHFINFCSIPAAALKIEGKEEVTSEGSVWRIQNAKGEGPYCFENRTTLEQQIEAFDKIIWGHIYDSCGVMDSLNTFLHPGPIDDRSIGLRFFGWKSGEPINKHEMYEWENPVPAEAHFGFLLEAQAKAWFPEDAREVLSWFGYSLMEVQAAKIIAKSGHQCVYLPA